MGTNRFLAERRIRSAKVFELERSLTGGKTGLIACALHASSLLPVTSRCHLRSSRFEHPAIDNSQDPVIGKRDTGDGQHQYQQHLQRSPDLREGVSCKKVPPAGRP